MDAERFDHLVASLSRGRSRRNALRAMVIGAGAALSIVTGTGGGDAGKASRRRRRRLKRQAKRRRQRCLAACGESCSLCFFDIEGEIVCGNAAGTTCIESNFCTANTDCGAGAVCLTRVQIRGSAEIQRFGTGFCEVFPDGLCATPVACAP